MFRYVRDALSGHFGHPADFLAEFQRRNYFLDDFVLDPIAQSASRRDREELFQQWAPSLVARLAEMRPQVMLLMRIAPHVEAARQRGSMWFITKSHSRAQANKAIFAAVWRRSFPPFRVDWLKFLGIGATCVPYTSPAQKVG